MERLLDRDKWRIEGGQDSDETRAREGWEGQRVPALHNREKTSSSH